MKIKILFLFIGMLGISTHAQRGIKIGYIDTEYILENIPEYKEAKQQLDTKIQNWKKEVDIRLKKIEQKREELENERVLLTRELYEERKEDINFEEEEILDYQQKRFGPGGDLMIQKKNLMQPVQDQIFNAVQEIATLRKYDFIFDKSADVVMLYSAKRFNISDNILRTITRASKRQQAKSKSELKEAKGENPLIEMKDEFLERKKALEEKKKAYEERRKKMQEEKAKARQAKLDTKNKKTEDSTTVEEKTEAPK